VTDLLVLNLRRQPYRPVLELQRELVQARIAGDLHHDALLLVEHDPVITLGRGTRETSLPVPVEALRGRGFEVVDVERGGDVTIHAPGQLVGYPILDLQAHRPDVHWYLRQLEESLIRALGRFGIGADRNPGFTGVWVGPRKIASIGVHVKRWVTLHGFALNVTTNLRVFETVVPCGIEGVVMTSLAKELDPTTPAPPAQLLDLDTPVERQGLFGAARDAVVLGFGEVFERIPVPVGVDALPPLPSLGSLRTASGAER
jgi:lipoate-protein ligase B